MGEVLHLPSRIPPAHRQRYLRVLAARGCDAVQSGHGGFHRSTNARRVLVRMSVPTGGIGMSVAEMKREVIGLLDRMPQAKVATVYDFVQFLTEREDQKNWALAQEQSAAYRDWLGADNDVYDEVFADAAETR